MKFLLIVLLLAVAIAAGYFSVSESENKDLDQQKTEEVKVVKKIEQTEPKKENVNTEEKTLPPKIEKKAEVKKIEKPKTNIVKKKAPSKEDTLNSKLNDAIDDLGEKLLKRKTRSMRTLLEKLSLNEADKQFLTELMLLHDKNAFGANSDEDFAIYIEDQIAELMGDDYEMFENRSTYKMLGDLQDMFKDTPLTTTQETDVINYFNKNMDSGLINKIIAAEYNPEGFKGANNPLLDFDSIKGQLDIWKDAPVDETQSKKMITVHAFLTEGLRTKAAELNIKQVLGE